MRWTLPLLGSLSTSHLSRFQLREFSKYWFDLSKLAVASLILKFFEPEALWLGSFSVLTICLGLAFSALLAILGLRFAKEVEKNECC